MLRTNLMLLLLVLFIAPAISAQHPDRFLSEVFGINSFKISSSLSDIQKNKQVGENLVFFHAMDNWAIFDLSGQPVNLPGLKPLDRLAFDTIELKFENNKLHDVELFIPTAFKDEVLPKTMAQFNTEYGQAAIVDVKKYKYKKSVWNLGANELTLTPLESGLLIHYGSKILSKKTGWIYSDRKGKGNGTLQASLAGFEKLLEQNLSVTSFEKLLPQWETTGALNHIEYLPLNKTSFLITYSLPKYGVAVGTSDTTSKIISEITLDSIKDIDTFSRWEKDLDSLHYIKEPKLNYIASVGYSNHKLLVILDKERHRISVINILKTMLP